MSRQNLLQIFITALLFLAVGYFLGQQTQLPAIFSEQRQPNSSYQFINPLLECDSSASYSQNVSLASLRSKLENTITELKNTRQLSFASIYYRDLNNGPWLGINEKEEFSPASLVKVPLMMSYFKAAESTPSLLQELIPATTTPEMNIQNILPTISLAPDQNYTVGELINRMIVYSDNQAYDLLLEYLNNHLGNRLIVNTFTDLGIDISQGFTNPGGNIINVKSYAAFFRVLYNSSYLNRDMSEKALRLLSQVEYRDGLVKGVSNPDIVIAHKFGERTFDGITEKQLHDCGIVYVPSKPYLICIMTRGTNLSTLSTSIARLSSIVYQSVSQSPAKTTSP